MAENEDILTPAEMRKWLTDEIRDRKREHELREKEATEFVTAYEEGKITPSEADERFYEHSKRWGEAFKGYLSTTEGLSDEEVLRRYEAQLKRYGEGRSSREFSR
jgi:phage repressor protein C with HTH and peptisase S24 domain